MLDPPTHSCQFDANCVGRFNIWVTKTNRPSFCLVLKLCLSCTWWSAVYYLGWMVVNNMRFFLDEASLKVTYFRHCCLGFFLAWSPFIFWYRSCDGNFPGFGKYVFPQLQTCTALVLSADCTEGSCSSNIVIFNNFFVFSFPFINFVR